MHQSGKRKQPSSPLNKTTSKKKQKKKNNCLYYQNNLRIRRDQFWQNISERDHQSAIHRHNHNSSQGANNTVTLFFFFFEKQTAQRTKHTQTMSGSERGNLGCPQFVRSQKVAHNNCHRVRRPKNWKTKKKLKKN
jgi:hypothetical protein